MCGAPAESQREPSSVDTNKSTRQGPRKPTSKHLPSWAAISARQTHKRGGSMIATYIPSPRSTSRTLFAPISGPKSRVRGRSGHRKGYETAGNGYSGRYCSCVRLQGMPCRSLAYTLPSEAAYLRPVGLNQHWRRLRVNVGLGAASDQNTPFYLRPAVRAPGGNPATQGPQSAETRNNEVMTWPAST